MLTPASYLDAERTATRTASNRMIAAFWPGAFAAIGYPHRVEDESELVRYVDVMQDIYADKYFARSFLFSRQEADLIQKTGQETVELAKALFSRPIRPILGPLAAIDAFRAIQAIRHEAAQDGFTVFELGPGSGYLGALCLLSGMRHVSSDCAQAFYLWQNRLFSRLAGPKFIELAGALAGRWKDGACVHVPWWQLADAFRMPVEAYGVDLVVCDHALNELTPTAFRYFSRLAARAVRGSRCMALVATHFGMHQYRCNGDVVSGLREVGFKLIFDQPFFCFALGDGDHATLKRAANTAIEQRKAGTLGAYDFVPISREESPIEYDLLEFMGWEVPKSSRRPVTAVDRVNAFAELWRNQGARVLVYGAGEHTAMLMRQSSLLTADVIGLADADPALHGRMLWGKRVFAPSEIIQLKPDAILLSSRASEDFIHQDLRRLLPANIPLVRLYTDDQAT